MTPGIRLPEFCPRPSCPFYDRDRARCEQWYRRYGSFSTLCRGVIQRFRCRHCGKTCSTQTFSIHYWTHSTYDYRFLLYDLCSGGGLRQHARATDVSFRVVQNRLRHLSRNCLAVLDAAATHPKMETRLAMDGFESFTRSQYVPNNITLLVGAGSQYVHAGVLTLLRRKGRMRDDQRRNRAKLDVHWRPRRGALREDVQQLLRDHQSRIRATAEEQPVVLATDRHKEYPRAILREAGVHELIQDGRLIHQRISSRAPRTRHNPLFAVNYVDRQIRKDMGEHVRETVKYAREANCQMERFAIYLVTHNFLGPHRVRDGTGTASDPTHADVANIPANRYRGKLDRLFTNREIWGHSKRRMQWQKRIWKHEYQNPPVVRFKSGEVSSQKVAVERLSSHFVA